MICLNCNFGYDKIIIKNFSYNFYSGECYHISGDNGIGKTTLLRGLCGLLQPMKGNITSVELSSVYFLPANGFDFFDFNSVKQSIELLNIIHNDRNLNDQYFKKFIYDLQDKKISELSDGQKQFLRLIPIFYDSKKIVILDEPFNSIALEHVETILKLMTEIQDKIIIFSGHLKINSDLGIKEIKIGEVGK